jgi:hypothetical protein
MSASFMPIVEAEEEVYRYQPADNGAGPMWCHGNTCIVRVGDQVFASGLETLEGAKPLHNCVPLLFRRAGQGWERLYRGEGRTREPSPLVCLGDRVLLSVNPTLTPPDTYSGPAQPQILSFGAVAPGCPPRPLLPGWQGAPAFTEHSYRTFVADAGAGELVLFQNIDHTHAEWALGTPEGQWPAQGQLAWPWGREYDEPQPIRTCYPVVQLKGRALYFCGVSDIVEPYKEWREHKLALTGRKWDYDFRRLFFTWSDDLGSGRFHQWLELSSRDRTAGWIFPLDLWVGPDRRVHILWSERALDERLRERFFPLEKQSTALHYAVVRDGVVLLRRALQVGGEGEPPAADRARFQATPEGRLFVFYHRTGGNYLLELSPEGVPGPPVPVPLAQPLPSFFTATERGGSPPANILDVLGETHHTLRYARIRLAEGR